MGLARSAPVSVDESLHNYQVPSSQDSRSPCPVLNTLANHGYLPRDGNNLTPEMLQLVLQEKLGFSWLTAKILISMVYKKVGKDGLLSLSDLNYHGPDSIEHDASLSRLDAALSNNQQYKFNQERFNKFVSFSKDGKFLTTDDVAAARLYFKADSMANNPEVLWNKRIETIAWGQASFLLYILGKDGKISIDDAKHFFEQETFPPNWEKHSLYGIIDLVSNIRVVQNAAQEHEKQEAIEYKDT